MILLVALAINWMMSWLNAQLEHSDSSGRRFMMTGMIVLILVAYALLIAVPFVPGIEIGLALLAMKGASIAPYVYVFTVLGLWLAFVLGQKLSYRFLEKTLADFGLRRASGLVAEIAPMSPGERADWMEACLPPWLGARLVRWRYVLLAVAINVPGNALIGGGGGICFTAGLTRLFDLRLALLTIAVAVAPMPVLFYSFGVFEF